MSVYESIWIYSPGFLTVQRFILDCSPYLVHRVIQLGESTQGWIQDWMWPTNDVSKVGSLLALEMWKNRELTFNPSGRLLVLWARKAFYDVGHILGTRRGNIFWMCFEKILLLSVYNIILYLQKRLLLKYKYHLMLIISCVTTAPSSHRDSIVL